MSEQISTLSDSELAEENFSRELQGLLGNKKSQQVWRDYQMIGDAMRGVPTLRDDFTARLMEKIELEPTVLAPSALPRIKQRAAANKKSALPAVWSLAASCAAVLVVGWAMVNQQWQALPEAGLELTATRSVQPSPQVVLVQQAVVDAQANQAASQAASLTEVKKPSKTVDSTTQQVAVADALEEDAPIAPLEYLAAHHASAPSASAYYLQTASYSE